MKRLNALLIAAAVLAAPGVASAGQITAIFGSGNADTDWTVSESNGVELGLRGKLRYNASGLPENTFNWNGVDTYTFAAGVAPTQAAPKGVWSFEWSINSDSNGTASRDLNDLVYELSATSVASGVGFTFDPINTAWADHSIGDNSTANGAGTEAGYLDTATYQGLIAGNNVAQNSWQPQWFITGFDPTVGGDYVFNLKAYDRNSLRTLLAQTEMTIHVTAVPLPPAAWMGLGLLAGVGFLRRRRRNQ